MAEKFFGGAEKIVRGVEGEKMLGVAWEGAGGQGEQGGQEFEGVEGKKMEEEKNITMTGQSNQRKTREDRGSLLSNGC